MRDSILKFEHLDYNIHMTEQGGSITEVFGRVNYYENVLKNPTKHPEEARDYLYEELDRLGAFVTDGVTAQDFERINQQIENISGTYRERVTLMIGGLKEKANKGEIGEGDAIALITEPRTKETVAIRVPSRK